MFLLRPFWRFECRRSDRGAIFGSLPSSDRNQKLHVRFVLDFAKIDEDDAINLQAVAGLRRRRSAWPHLGGGLELPSDAAKGDFGR
jgi:hypothetical protein